MCASEKELVQRCIKGEEKAWAEFIQRYRALIYSVIVRFESDPESREDLFQDVCLRVSTRLHMWNPEMARLSTWLFTVTRHVCLNYIEKKEREREGFGEFIEESKDLPITSSEGQLRAQLEQVMDEVLSDLEKLVVSLTFFNGLTGHKIAGFFQAVGQSMSEATINRIKNTALKKLGEEWKNSGPDLYNV